MTAAPVVRARLLTPDEAADRLGLSRGCLKGWRVRGCGPPFVALGKRRVRYREADLERFVESRVRASTSATEPPAEECP
jgi:predicted DNA-binding transcriptional regulator AlpA